MKNYYLADLHEPEMEEGCSVDSRVLNCYQFISPKYMPSLECVHIEHSIGYNFFPRKDVIARGLTGYAQVPQLWIHSNSDVNGLQELRYLGLLPFVTRLHYNVLVNEGYEAQNNEMLRTDLVEQMVRLEELKLTYAIRRADYCQMAGSRDFSYIKFQALTKLQVLDLNEICYIEGNDFDQYPKSLIALKFNSNCLHIPVVQNPQAFSKLRHVTLFLKENMGFHAKKGQYEKFPFRNLESLHLDISSKIWKKSVLIFIFQQNSELQRLTIERIHDYQLVESLSYLHSLELLDIGILQRTVPLLKTDPGPPIIKAIVSIPKLKICQIRNWSGKYISWPMLKQAAQKNPGLKWILVGTNTYSREKFQLGNYLSEFRELNFNAEDIASVLDPKVDCFYDLEHINGLRRKNVVVYINFAKVRLLREAYDQRKLSRLLD